MPVTKNRIENNLQQIRARIAEACRRAGRCPQEVSIVAVVKTVDLETVKNLLDLGLTDLGESRAQQLAERAAEVAEHVSRRRNDLAGPLRWHMIGHLQRNKVKQVLPVASLIHSVDSLRLAEEIDSRCARMDCTMDVMLQVNCSQEAVKSGCAVGAAVHLAEMICTLKQLRLVGLMTMAPLTEDSRRARAAFVRLRELFEEMVGLKIGGADFRHLSMGMSRDYAAAVEEGATMLRIGTALFA